MSGAVTVEVVCHHEKKGGGEPLVVYRSPVTEDRVHSLKYALRSGGRVLVNGVRLDPDDGVTISRILLLARQTGYFPTLVHQLWCPCGVTVEVSETELRQTLERAATSGVSQAELTAFDR